MESTKQYVEMIDFTRNAAPVSTGETVIPKGIKWSEVREQLLTPEERAASALRVAMMIEIANARKERGLSQRKLEELSGVKQPIIARMEKGTTNTQIGTLLKVLTPLGKTLYIGDLPAAKG